MEGSRCGRGKTARSRKGVRFFTAGGLLLVALALLRYPQEAGQAVREGLGLCYQVILPALFPFLILTGLVVSLGLAEELGRLLAPVMGPLFHLSGPCSAALVLGAIGGYPVGARTVRSLLEQGQCSRTEGERLLGFCCNAAPAFLLGVVGSGIFGSRQLGLFLWGVHLTAAALTGLLFRPLALERRGSGTAPAGESCSFSTAFVSAVQGALHSGLNVCSFVVCFSVVLQLGRSSGALPALAGLLATLLTPFGVAAETATRLLTGLLELSSGVTTLQGVGMSRGAVTLCSFFLGWAGLSVHCQIRSLLEGSGLSLRYFLLGKLSQGLLSAGLVWLLFPLLPASVTTGSWSAGPLVLPSAGQLLAGATAVGLGLFILLCLLQTEKVEKGKKMGRRKGRNRV